MSEDEVKTQSEETTPETIKKEANIKEGGKEEENGDKVEEEEEEEDMETDVVKEEVKEEVEEEDKEEEEEEAEVEEEEAEEEEAEEEEAEEAMEDDVKEKKVKEKIVKEKKVKPEVKKEVKEPETPDKNVVPLYDQPLEMSGKRDRKKVERFIQEEKKEELKFEGSGTALGDIPFINAMITNVHGDELKVLHRVAYSRPGKGAEIKKNLRQFNGFSFTKDDKKYEAKILNIERILMSEIKKMLNILGLERAGKKGEVVERLLEFMMEPKDTGRKPPKAKKSKSRGRPKKGQEKAAKNASTASGSDAESDSDSSSSNDDDDDAGDDADDDGEEEKPKKTPAKKTPAKKTPAKKTPAKKTPQVKKAAVKRPASSTKKQPKVSKTVSSSDSESDDEPLAKKVKQPPTDSEIKAMVKKILDGANLEEVTMKSVCRQVYDSYPDFDLTHKKDFIKETVKSIIS